MLQSKCVCLKDNWLSITSQLTVHVLSTVQSHPK